MEIQELKESIKKANVAYRKGNSIISDKEYDNLIDELISIAPNDPLLYEIGFLETNDSRKEKLPITMASMNKLKTFEEIARWFHLKKIPVNTEIIITPKYDGLSFAMNEKTGNCWTRGNGIEGQRSDEHFKYIDNILNIEGFTFGEVIIPRKSFFDKWKDQYANPRNFVAGLINTKDSLNKVALSDCNYIRYGYEGVEKFKTKQEVFDYLNGRQEVDVPYRIVKLEELSTEYLKLLYLEFGKVYEIDGLILEINDLNLQKELGRETSTLNPVYARAYKANFEEVKETKVVSIDWFCSKNGLQKPVLNVEPVMLDGALVSRITGNNAAFVKNMSLGVGSRILALRSGGVIPLIREVLEAKPCHLPTYCSCSKTIPLEWNDTQVELVCKNPDCEHQFLKKIVSFFEVLEVANFSEKTIIKVIEAGYDSVAKILRMTQADFLKIEGFAARKAEIVYNAIQEKIKNVDLATLMHSANIFDNLGSKKLNLVAHFKTKPSMDELLNIEGFSHISASTFLKNYDQFWSWFNTLPITLKEDKKINNENMSNELEGRSFCFSGVRRKDLEEIIVAKGGKIASGVTKNTTDLILKDIASTSSKSVKAHELGIAITSVDDLEAILNEN